MVIKMLMPLLTWRQNTFQQTINTLTVMTEIECVVHELNVGSHSQPIQIRNKSDEVIKAKVQVSIALMWNRKVKRVRVSKIGNVALFVAAFLTSTFLCVVCNWECCEISCAFWSLCSIYVRWTFYNRCSRKPPLFKKHQVLVCIWRKKCIWRMM